MAVTQKDISKRAGVSIATVSLALRGDKRVLKLKRERIQELAREMGYVPNPFGRSLQANRSRLIGYLAPTLTSSFYDEVIQEISDFAGVKGYGVLLGVNINPEAYRRHLKLLREKRVDGIIAAYYPSQCVKDLLEVEQAGTPIVVCDFETFSLAVPKVQIDNRLAMEMVTEHLVGLGHKRFAYYRVVNDDSLERCRVCNEILSSHGLAEAFCCDDEGELSALFDSADHPSAVICYSDRLAVGAKHVVERHGLGVPGDVSITGFDDIEIASWPEFDLTTVAQPKDTLGKGAVEMLLARIAGEKVETRLLEPRLIIRGSTAAAHE